MRSCSTTPCTRLIKLGPDGALTGALAALDIAMWDLKGKITGLPIYKLIGGAWKTSLPFYASIGGNAERSPDEVVKVVESRLRDKPSAIKIRFDNNRTTPDLNIAGDIEKARLVRKVVGDNFPLAFDANNGYTVGGAIRVGRALEELGYWWFEEPVQHYHPRAMGEVARMLDITVSAGEQTYTLPGLNDLINAGVRMIQPDIVKMGGITGLLRCAALAHATVLNWFRIRRSRPSVIRQIFTSWPPFYKTQSPWSGTTHPRGLIRYSIIRRFRQRAFSSFPAARVLDSHSTMLRWISAGDELSGPQALCSLPDWRDWRSVRGCASNDELDSGVSVPT